MGYTLYWSRSETPDRLLPSEPREAYCHLDLDDLDALAIIGAAERRGLALADGVAEQGSRPVLDEAGIWLNGAHPDHAGTFTRPAQLGEPRWTEMTGHHWWDACTTNRRPYDLVVCAMLIRAGAPCGPSVRNTSDGAWRGSVLCGRWWPEWGSARQLVAQLFGADADRSPLLP